MRVSKRKARINESFKEESKNPKILEDKLQIKHAKDIEIAEIKIEVKI